MSLVSPTIEHLAPYEAGKPLETLESELGVRPVLDPQALRVTVGLPEENDRFLSALAEVLSK